MGQSTSSSSNFELGETLLEIQACPLYEWDLSLLKQYLLRSNLQKAADSK